MQHSAQATEEVRVDEFSCTFPPKVRVVKVVIRVEAMQICSEFLGGLEFIHVDVRAVRRSAGVVFRPGPHHYGQDVAARTVIRKIISEWAPNRSQKGMAAGSVKSDV